MLLVDSESHDDTTRCVYVCVAHIQILHSMFLKNQRPTNHFFFVFFLYFLAFFQGFPKLGILQTGAFVLVLTRKT